MSSHGASTPSTPRELPRLYRSLALGAMLWSGLVGASLYWNLTQEAQRVVQLAEAEAKASLGKDLAFRRWATRHGGLYVEVSPNTPPIPFMAIVPERDIVTPSGRQLTLYNPASILRLLMQTQTELYGIKARITGEKYLNPDNAPDPWESKALAVVARTLRDYSEVTELDGRPVLRRMQPMIMEPGCLKCHAWTGIPVGQLRGATDVAIPLAPYQQVQAQASRRLTASHAGLWLLGLVFLGGFGVRRRAYLLEAQRQEAQLRKLNLAVDQNASGILITDRDGLIEYANRKLLEITGYERDEVIGRHPNLFKSQETDAAVYGDMWATLLAGQEWHGEFKNRKKSGEVFWCLETISPIKDQEGLTTHYVAVVEDVSSRKFAEATIHRLAFYDPLTELPNRRLLQERLEQAQARARRDDGRFALLYLDLDRFKTINDTLGHGAGDQVLKAVAERFLACLRQSDTLARLGGDEFAILVETVRHEREVSVLAERLLASLVPPIPTDAQELFVSTSIGISLYPGDTQDLAELLRNADTAMYHAKGSGKNGYCFYDQGLNRLAVERLALETGLRQAIANDELFVEYQPKQELAGGRIYGMEALLRWRHPQRGLVPPDKFIPLAEEIREIDRIGAWVLRAACRQTRAWLDAGHALVVSVNVSALQFQRSDLLAVVEDILAETGLPAQALELEITESALVDNHGRAREVLAQLADLGLAIAIDDFGTGYSSLSHLKHLPVHTLKIDRSFINDLTEDHNDRAIAASIVSLAHNMGLEVIAEGVETGEQLAILRELGCHRIQGYYLSRPLGPRAFEDFLRRQAGDRP